MNYYLVDFCSVKVRNQTSTTNKCVCHFLIQNIYFCFLFFCVQTKTIHHKQSCCKITTSDSTSTLKLDVEKPTWTNKIFTTKHHYPIEIQHWICLSKSTNYSLTFSYILVSLFCNFVTHHSLHNSKRKNNGLQHIDEFYCNLSFSITSFFIKIKICNFSSNSKCCIFFKIQYDC